MAESVSLTGELGASRLAVLEELRRLPDDAWAPGQWVARGVVAHLAAWDEISTAYLEAASSAESAPPPVSDYDAFNEGAVAEATPLSAVQVVLRFHAARAALVAVVSRSDAEMHVAFPWGGEGTVRELVLDLISHERYHAGELAKSADA